MPATASSWPAASSTRDEIDLLRRAAKEDNELDKRSFGRADGEGGVVRLSLWNHPGDGIYGMFARCERMVDALREASSATRSTTTTRR